MSFQVIQNWEDGSYTRCLCTSQKDLDRLKKWADKLSQVQQRKMQSPAPGEVLSHLKSHFAIKDLEVLVGSKLTMTQQCTVTAKRANNL